MTKNAMEVTNGGCQRGGEFVLKGICKGTKVTTKQNVADDGQVGLSGVQSGAVGSGT